MKTVQVIVLAGALALANVAGATNPVVDDSIHNTATATGGAGGAGGKSESSSAVLGSGNSSNTNVNAPVANGGKASADSVNVNSQKTDVDASSRNTNVNGQKQGQGQLQGQGQGQSTSIDFGTTKVEVAAPAADVHAMTTGSDATICGSVGGVSGQGGLFGGSISSESYACLAHKHSLYQAEAHSETDLLLENFQWYFPPFQVFRMCRTAIFN